MRVARYHATFAQRWAEYLGLALVVGSIGEIAMGSIAAGQRTQSSYPRFLASTNPSDLTITHFGTNTAGDNSTPYFAVC